MKQFKNKLKNDKLIVKDLVGLINENKEDLMKEDSLLKTKYYKADSIGFGTKYNEEIYSTNAIHLKVCDENLNSIGIFYEILTKSDCNFLIKKLVGIRKELKV